MKTSENFNEKESYLAGWGLYDRKGTKFINIYYYIVSKL